MVSSNNLISDSDKFSSPSEFTPIDSAVIGQPWIVDISGPDKIYPWPQQHSPINQEGGALKIPKETTPIDVAVFRMPQENDHKGNSIMSDLQDQLLVEEKKKASQQFLIE